MNLDGTYQVKGWPGVAVYVAGYPQVWEPYMTYVEDPETGEEYEEDSGEGEWVDDLGCDQVLVVMVGDDAKHRVDVDDLVPIDEDDYCPECGQIGCHAYG